MANIYEEKTEGLHQLLDRARADDGATVLIPDLQRPFVWTPSQVGGPRRREERKSIVANIYEEKSEGLHQLLDRARADDGATVLIPDLQRPIVWTPSQVSLLLD